MGEFKIVHTNCTSIFVAESLSIPWFRYWVQFLNEFSNVRYVVLTLSILNINQLLGLYTNVVDTSILETLSFTFSIGAREIMVTDRDLNRILHFPTKNHIPFLDVFDILGFVTRIRYKAAINLGDMYKHHLSRVELIFTHVDPCFCS